MENIRADLISFFNENGFLVSQVEAMKLKSDSSNTRNMEAFFWACDFANEVKAHNINYTLDDNGLIISIEIRR